MDYQDQRTNLVDWTKKQLIGVTFQDDTLVGIAPLARFFTGILFPVLEGELGDDQIEDDFENDDQDTVKPVKKEKRYMPPSSAGFSFYITGEAIKLRIFYSAVWYQRQYERDDRNQKLVSGVQKWLKTPLTRDDGEEIEFTLNGNKEYKIFGDQSKGEHKAKVNALWRPYQDGYIVTISLSNTQRVKEEKDYYLELNQKALFEVVLKCIVESGVVAHYPSTNRALLSDEEKEIELRYKDIRTYAVGHGTGVDWRKNKKGKMEIWADFMPSVEVPQVTADTGDNKSRTLEFHFLSECEGSSEVTEKLTKFVDNYGAWISGQEKESIDEDKDDLTTAKNIVQRQVIAGERMEQGVRLLERDKYAKTAFALANRAILMQMQATDQAKGKNTDEKQYQWRPFQLAFILMVLESSINEDSAFRDTLDLIWFPTGGGKTEAYLGLMAFLFIYRRLRYPASYGGTAAIMRYTLRLLTSQQFIRACKVIFALELLRRRDTERFGTQPITAGLWVGTASSPNTFSQANECKNNKQFSKFIITSCPWCNTPFTEENYIVREDTFHFTCTHKDCDFGREQKNILPCNVVDQSLYKDPPSLLIATVDKFARLTWDERAGNFFGLSGNRPPEFIIQDELHLIASALGSIVGLYEAGIDTLLIARGVRAKYVASTATIKHAEQQVKTLFARDMLVFPPPGLRHDDSYFAKTIPLEEKPGRLYIGFLAPYPSRQRCLSPLTAALLAAPVNLFHDREEYVDAWWSQVIYHGTLKGVGNSRTLYQSDAETYLTRLTLEALKGEIDAVKPGFIEDDRFERLDDYRKITDPEIKAIVDRYLPMRDLNIKTLTSNQSAEDNGRVFADLTKEFSENDSIDVVLATNMISVGLDVARLALMIINGQPFTTAEYIQASSRVGRGKVPGIVFANYYKTQARSLSHYENFRSYHDSFYRYVEPSSQTPFTYQARTRALHAALVIAVRHGIPALAADDKAEQFNPGQQDVKKIIRTMQLRLASAIGDEKTIERVHRHLDALIAEWHTETRLSDSKKRNLVYFSKDRASDNLLCNFDAGQGLWPTLQSMRNVENSALMKLLPGVKKLNAG
jgi:hypothetical protein